MHALCSSVPSSRYISWFVSRVPHSFPHHPHHAVGREATVRSEQRAKRVEKRPYGVNGEGTETPRDRREHGERRAERV